MRYNKLGRSDLRVSNICLGTMTWGEQNTEEEAWRQMDYARDRGINFFDTAELYPVPRRRETHGLTEEYIGNWLTARGGREKLVLATKVVGPGAADWFRPGGAAPRLNRQQITYALEQSLRRLKTDYVDLYQLHWPDRPLNLFSESRGYSHIAQEDAIPLSETLAALDDLVRAGKIRHVGLSNETAWGVMKCLHHAASDNLPRVQSVQNAYNLLNRLYEQGLAEISLREQAPLLAYSPIGGGTLSGKYLDGRLPPGSRQQLFPEFAGRYRKPAVHEAVAKYVALAREMNLSPIQLAQKFVDSRPFVASSIIGATSLDQLRENIGAFDISWSPELEQRVEEIHLQNPDPAP